ncbi:protein-disulfide reductase DsbD domain-containing protein [Aestuariivirga sp. YIM B02566]|uniref:Uncharacterized protein n=1 Tax=Taklimakanibacter albus TaxID=2800327 RepID=A0ACC5RDI3_9HYPH|nr:protein-disulfide reductase DsbD domain-containing protein [Aestuariivirga sp. YIM B02566]MBK1870458.1 hypothetical protein [Aestuariivirga sp. YIM B02566]
MKRRQLLIAAFGLPALSLAARAETGRHYTVRLISGETQNGIWRAGLDITLEQGWKTYWRMPGDAGVPPQFDWAGSKNVKSVSILWPAPKRYSDDGGETVGYKERVVFPLDVTPEQAGRPMDLALEAFFGVCDVVCIPAKFDADLLQKDASPADASLIAAFAARVPQKADAGARFRVARATIGEAGGKPALAVSLAGEGFDGDLDIFVEGNDFAYFRAPRRTADKAVVQLPVDGLKDPASLKGKPLTLTMVAGDIHLEQVVVVD